MIDLKNIQTEVDTSYLYKKLSEHETDSDIAAVFLEMSQIEREHALSFLKKFNKTESSLPLPSKRARLLNKIGSLISYDIVLGIVLDTEKNLSRSILKHRKERGESRSVSDTAHVAILQNLIQNKTISPGQIAKFEKKHRTIGSNALRAAVLGGNDGLVSNFSLIMGVAGASSSQNIILLSGLAGLLAGALSMALGEWISVKSSQELYENQMIIEEEELKSNPEGELKELALMFRTKGIPETEAHQMATELFKDEKQALSFLIQEELGIHTDELEGSPMEAAVASFILFAFGAVIPLIPFFFFSGLTGILLSTGFSAIGLFVIGAAITLFTGKDVWYSGFRQVLFGIMAAAITFGIGKLIGVSL